MTGSPVYILIRTSNRPRYFERMMETIKNQTYKNIVTIVHTDDPRDKYVQGDIIIKGSAYPPKFGSGTYNLYNNRLLAAIPAEPGYFHFIDDDDEYYDETIIERLVKNSKPDHVNVGRVIRWNNTVWPKDWGRQKSYQTECFFVHTDHRRKSKWWANKGGDHYYSKQLTRVLPVNWINDLIICRAQEGKGHGKKLDRGGKVIDLSRALPFEEKVYCIALLPYRLGNVREHLRQGECKMIKYGQAYELEKKGIVKITYYSRLKEHPKIMQIMGA